MSPINSEPQLAHRKLDQIVRSYPLPRQLQLISLLLEEVRYYRKEAFCRNCQTTTKHDKVKELDEINGLFWDDLQCQECGGWKEANCRILWIDEQDDKRNAMIAKEAAQ